MMFTITILWLISFFTIHLVFCEQVLYVSTNGTSSGDCLEDDSCTLERALSYITQVDLNSTFITIQMEDGMYNVDDIAITFPKSPRIERLTFTSSDPEDIGVTWKVESKGVNPPILHFNETENTPTVIFKGLEFDLTMFFRSIVFAESKNVDLHYETWNCRFSFTNNDESNPIPFKFENTQNSNIDFYAKSIDFGSSVISSLMSQGTSSGVVNITIDGLVFSGGRILDNFLFVDQPKDFSVVLRDLDISDTIFEGSFVRIRAEYNTQEVEDKLQKLSFTGCKFENVDMHNSGNLVRAYPSYLSTHTNMKFQFRMEDCSFDTIEIKDPVILFDIDGSPKFDASFNSVNVTRLSGNGTFYHCYTEEDCVTTTSTSDSSSSCEVNIKGGYYTNNEISSGHWGGLFHRTTTRSNGKSEDLGVVKVDGGVFTGNKIQGEYCGVISTINQIFEVQNAVFLDNHALKNFDGTGGDGGALNHIFTPPCYDCQNSIAGSRFESNYAETNGGAVYVSSTLYLDISSSEFTRNVAMENGGSLYLTMEGHSGIYYPSKFTIDKSSSIEYSRAKLGAGMIIDLDETGELNVDSPIEYNNASVGAGGVYFVEKAVDAKSVENNIAPPNAGPNYLSEPKRIGGLSDVTGSCDDGVTIVCKIAGLEYYDYFGTKLFLPLLKTVEVSVEYLGVTSWEFTVDDPTEGSVLSFEISYQSCQNCMMAGETELTILLNKIVQGKVIMKFPDEKSSSIWPSWVFVVISVGFISIVVVVVCLVLLLCCAVFGIMGLVTGIGKRAVKKKKKKGYNPLGVNIDDKSYNLDENVFFE